MALECAGGHGEATLPERMRMEQAAAAASNGDESYIAAELGPEEKQALLDFKLAISAAATAGEFSVPGGAGTKDPSPSREALSLWKVPLLDDAGDEGTDVVLLKFLRAREFKVDLAMAMLKNTLEWRRSYGCDGLEEEAFDAGIDSTGFYYGRDKVGHPVCYNVIDAGIYQECFEGRDRMEKLLRWRVKLMEAGIKLLDFSPRGVSSIVQVIDLKNFSMKKEARAALFDTIQLLSDNYPELVSKLMLVNVPWYYNALYVMVCPFLTQRTRNKICIASKGRSSEALFKIISPENVPPQYGGFGKANDERFRNVKAPITESCVKPGSMLIIEIQVNEGDDVSWEISIPGWDVSYGAEFSPSAEGGYTVVVEKSRKILPDETGGGICNSFKTKSPGSLLLTVDNSASRKKKLVHYRYFVRG